MDNKLFQKLICHDPRVTYRFPELMHKNVLVLTPHPDDETLGCGGVIMDLIQKNINVEVLLITDGSEGTQDREVAENRLHEFHNAMKLLGITQINCWGFRDGLLKQNGEVLRSKLIEILQKSCYDIIFTPYIFDYHKDHTIVSYILADCLKPHPNILIAMYEIWTPILYPNYYVNITELFEKKLSAARCYETQDKRYGVIEKFTLLNALRAKLSMRSNFEYVEAFKCLTSSDYISEIQNLTKILN